MRIATRDRIWLLGGLVAALLLTFLVWQLLIKSQNDKTDSVKQDIDSAQQQVSDSTLQLSRLRADAPNLDKYKAELIANQAALPTESSIPAFLNELHAAGDAAEVSVVQLQVTPPGLITGPQAGTTPVYQLTVTVVATGSDDGIATFLKQLQADQPRAALLTSVAESPGAAGGANSLNLTMQIFVAPSNGKVPAAS
jgi:Tfp pilus assembly protein PilO